MSFNNSIPLVDYGLVNALQKVFPAPVVSKRNPTTADKAQIGQSWINVTSNAAWILTSIVNNSATWSDVTGGSGAFTTVVAALDITSIAGNIAAIAGSLSAGTTVTAQTGITATTGNITASNGDVVLSTAGTFLQLPGPVKIMSGAGAPANGLATEVGDMYINTTAASATTRLYIATAANTWTNVTCAA